MSLLTRRAICAGATAAMVFPAGSGALATTTKPADTIFVHGTIFTVDAKRPWAQAVSIRDGRIVFVGANDDALRFRGPETRVVDLAGRLVLPGFIDPHNHVYLRAEDLFWVRLPGGPRPIGPPGEGIASLEGYRSAIAAYRAKTPGLQQVRGIGFDLDLVRAAATAQNKQPREVLDELVSDLPAAFLTHSHHEMWANTQALQLAGLDRSTPDPRGAVIHRDPATGEPNGLLNEFSAHNLVVSKFPEPDFTVEQHRQAILSWQEMASRRGVTGVLVPTHYRAPNFNAAIQGLSDQGDLTTRYNVAQWADENRGVSQVAELVATRARLRGGPHLKFNTVKIFATAVPESGLTMIWPQDSLNATMAALDKSGFRLFIHDIGPTDTYDKVLDAFAYVLAQNGRRDARHVISHIFPAAVPTAARLNALGVRADGHPAPKAFYDLGGPTSCSSDYPVWDFNPLPRLQAGVKEGVSLEAMVVSQTLRGAEAIFADKDCGSIEVGKSADLIALDLNIFRAPSDTIAQAKVVLHLFAGKALHQDIGLTAADLNGPRQL